MTDSPVHNFTPIDWAIVGVYLIGILVAGWFCRSFIRGMADFTVAGRSLRPALAAATMIGSELGLITVMYSAQKGFASGFSVFHMAVSAAVVTLFVGLTGFIVVPLRRMGVMTIPEFYERRFSRGVRILGGAILAVGGILNMGMFLKAGAIFVSGITGLEDVDMIMTVMLGMVLAYTMLGGMLSVVVTDYLQFLVLTVGMLVACWLAVDKLGWTHITETVIQHKGAAGVDPFLDVGGASGPSYVVWMVFAALVSAAVWQTAVMRACSAESTAAVKRLYVLSAIGFMIRFLIPFFLGIAAFVYFTGHETLREVYLGPDATSVDTLRAMPAFLGELLPVGLMGLVAAGMLAAFMSTNDSYLLCWSSVLTHDVVAPATGERMTDRQRVWLTRGFILVIGIFLLRWSLHYPLSDHLWEYLAITGAIYFTGAFALLLLGIYWRGASSAGAYAGLIAGSSAILGMGAVRKKLGITLEAHEVGLLAVAGALVVTVLVSLLVPDDPADRALAAEGGAE